MKYMDLNNMDYSELTQIYQIQVFSEFNSDMHMYEVNIEDETKMLKQNKHFFFYKYLF